MKCHSGKITREYFFKNIILPAGAKTSINFFPRTMRRRIQPLLSFQKWLKKCSLYFCIFTITDAGDDTRIENSWKAVEQSKTRSKLPVTLTMHPRVLNHSFCLSRVNDPPLAFGLTRRKASLLFKGKHRVLSLVVSKHSSLPLSWVLRTVTYDNSMLSIYLPDYDNFI